MLEGLTNIQILKQYSIFQPRNESYVQKCTTMFSHLTASTMACIHSSLASTVGARTKKDFCLDRILKVRLRFSSLPGRSSSARGL